MSGESRVVSFVRVSTIPKRVLEIRIEGLGKCGVTYYRKAWARPGPQSGLIKPSQLRAGV